MARKLVLLLALTSLLMGLASADWNILFQRPKNNLLGGGSNWKYYCESWRMNVELNNIRNFDEIPEECVDSIRKYMTSSQYKADIERAVEEITLFLSGSGCCTIKGDGKDAWIFDVDDTLLSTVPYAKKYGFGGKRNTTGVEEWMEHGKATAIESTLKLFNDIRDRGFKIFLISSRREHLRSSTVDNLIDEGYHRWTSLHLRGLGDEAMEVEQYKRQVRQKLVNQGYRIWGILGDQWSSFNGSPKAKRTFKLPNSMYYLA